MQANNNWRSGVSGRGSQVAQNNNEKLAKHYNRYNSFKRKVVKAVHRDCSVKMGSTGRNDPEVNKSFQA